MLHLTNAKSADGQPCEMLVQEGRIVDVGPKVDASAAESQLDCKGYTLLPGLVDLHVHLRDPGYEYKEDIASGTRAAAKGGFTAVCCMANTNPVNDTAAVTQYILKKATEEGVVRVYPIGAVTKGLKGEELAEMGDMQRAGAVAVSDDGQPICSGAMMRIALLYAKAFGLRIASHCEVIDLVGDGVMNEGAVSSLIGMKGIPASAEETMVARDCALALETGGKLHICHISTRGCVDIIRRYKEQGADITCETTPHYIAGTDALCMDYDSASKVSPPLRAEADRQAIIQGLVSGVIDCIATDHAPHHTDEKRLEYALAANGISGLETALALCYTDLVAAGHMSLAQLIDKMARRPCEVFSLPGGTIARGQVADFILFDTQQMWTIDSAKFVSRGKNTPFDGREVKGLVRATFVGGQCIYGEGIE